mmetsp:Transcript_86342/g.166213  ORF Transcript_86342/g.166213 Transcript_86342/m.166213 type:complete len:204 (+) Transcript_86342:409-1020(+)
MIFSSYTSIEAWKIWAPMHKPMPRNRWYAGDRACGVWEGFTKALSETSVMPMNTKPTPTRWYPCCRRPKKITLKRHVKMTMAPRVICTTDAAIKTYAIFTRVVAVQSKMQATMKTMRGASGDIGVLLCPFFCWYCVPMYATRQRDSPIIMSRLWKKGWSKPVLAAPGPVGTCCMTMNFIRMVLQEPLRSMRSIKVARAPAAPR